MAWEVILIPPARLPAARQSAHSTFTMRGKIGQGCTIAI
ncbi:hypothetical protein M3J09_006943 [Ascochyta lentis]